MYRAVCTGSLSLLIIRPNAQGYSWSTGSYRRHAEENKQHHRCTQRISFTQTHQAWGENSQHVLLKTFGVVHIEAEWLCRQQQTQHRSSFIVMVGKNRLVLTDSVCFFGTRWSLHSFLLVFWRITFRSHCASMMPLFCCIQLWLLPLLTITTTQGGQLRCCDNVRSCLRLQVPLCRGCKTQIHFDGVWWKMLRVSSEISKHNSVTYLRWAAHPAGLIH